MEILFIDNHIIIVYKPQNISINGKGGLKENLIEVLKAKNIKSTYLENINQLDSVAGGLVLFALTSKAKDRLKEQIDEQKFECRYLAVVVGENEKKNDFLSYYVHFDKNNKMQHIPQSTSNAFKINMQWKLLEHKQKISLVECTSQGQYEQEERFVLSESKMPIFGDALFGGDVLAKNTNTALWLVEIKLNHPITNKIMSFRMYPPIDKKPWLYLSVEKFLKI